MFIYADIYRCSSCGKFGKTKQLLAELKQKHGVLVARQTEYFRSPWRGWFEKYKDLLGVIDKAHDNLLRNNKTVYLSRRGFTLDTIKALKLGWLDDWITIPFYDDDGDLIGASARAGETNKSPAKYCNVPEQNPNLLYVPDWRLIDAKDKVYCVFGLFDAVSLFQLGLASISTTTGKHVDPSGFGAIQKRIIIIPDRGEEREGSILAANLGWRGKLFVPDWFDDTKDCNDVLMKHGNKELVEFLNSI